jgi:hypothetical protein
MPPIAPAPTTQTFIINLTKSRDEKTGAFYVKDCGCVHDVSHIAGINFRIDAFAIFIIGLISQLVRVLSKFKFRQSCVRLRALLTNDLEKPL